jgi:hypothetical protein
MKNLIYTIAISLLFFSCEEVPQDEIFDSSQPVDTNVVTENPKNVIILEYTAFQCNNCPPASKEVERIISLHGGKVIGMNIHASILADITGPSDPILFNSDSKQIWANAGSPPLPAGVVNYYANQNEWQNSFVTWSADAEEELQKETHLEIQLSAENVTESNFDINVDLIYFSDQLENERLAVFLIEDGIVGRQLDKTVEGGEVSDYVHNHVTRGGIENIAGRELFESKTEGDTISINYPNNSFPGLALGQAIKPENCRVVAFVFNEDTKYIYQAEELKLIEE